MKKDLTYWGELFGTDKATYHKFTDFYEEKINYINLQPSTILEIGIKDGDSLMMWTRRFPEAIVIGVDIEPINLIGGACTFCFDATDGSKLKRHFQNIQFDIIIDDGSHLMSHQQDSFIWLWDRVAAGGIYIIEDLHTSFLDSYIDREKTTFDWLTSSGLTYEIFQKDPNVKTDSMTAIIYK